MVGFMSQDRKWSVVLAGECMIARPFSMHDDPEFLSIIEELRTSDVSYAHLEMNFGEFSELEWPSRGDWTASYMIAEPSLAGELAWAGIDIMSLAHNHSMDFGASGMEATIRACKAAGITCAGTGCDLEEAREPAYFECRKGRVALISVSSGNKGYEWAGLPKASLRGRPGVNPLRVSMDYKIDCAAAEQLGRIAATLGIGRTLEDGAIRLSLPPDQSTRPTTRFVPGEGFGIKSTLYPNDLEGNLRSVNEATQMADLVMVAHHFNISEGPRGDEPPGFAQEFAHAVIDAGADIYIGHGWHKTLGIEVYKGKPVFYGMGNFVSQSEFIRRVPYDSYEAFGHDVERLPTLSAAVEPLHPGMDAAREVWWSSALVRLTMDDTGVREIRLHPVEMGRNADVEAAMLRPTGKGPHLRTEGRPRKADPENAANILDRLRRLSKPLGTEIEIVDGIGVIRL